MRADLLLTVLIPTFNRASFLETTVSQFVRQIEQAGLGSKVEILVGNDASADGTFEYLESIARSCPFLRVLHHPKNLGVSGNLEECIDKAFGKYIWLFGEDDLIVDGAVGQVWVALNQNGLNYVLINTVNIMSADNRNTRYQTVGGKRLNLETNMVIEDFTLGEKRLSAIDGWLYLTNLISAVIFKRELFLEFVGEAKKSIRTDNVYLFQAPLIIGIATLGRMLLLANPLVLHRKNESHWSKSILKILTVSLYDSYEIINLVKKYMPSEYLQYKRRFAAYVFGTLLFAKKRRINVTRHLVNALRLNLRCYPYNIRFLTLLLVPAIILRFVKIKEYSQIS